jgi:hypothetical protein
VTRLPFKSRTNKPTEPVSSAFKSAALEIASAFLKSEPFRHAATKGSEREIPVQEFFRKNLPGTYNVARGEVVDLCESHSPQLDIMIFDGQRNFPLLSGESCILPAEAFLVGIEVKSLLSRKELSVSLESASKLRKLRPFRMDLSSPREAGKAADKKSRYFYCLFAYNTDIAANDWLSKEHARLVDVANSLKIQDSVIDRLYVANRGLIHPDAKRGIMEEANSGVALLNLYMHILNFLARENG